MEQGNLGEAGAGCRGERSWLLLCGSASRRLKEVTRREAKQGLAAHSISNSAQDVLATLNADIAIRNDKPRALAGLRSI